MNVAHQMKQGLNYHQQGQLQQAKIIYQRILKSIPKHGDANHLLGIIAYQEGDYASATRLVQKAIKVEPHKAHMHNNMGEIYRACKEFKLAEVSYKKAIHIDHNFADAHNNLGIVLKELGDLEKAECHYRKVLELNPRHASAYNNIGILRAEKGNHEEAIKHYQLAISLEPRFAEALNNQGISLKQLNKINEAKHCFEQAVSLTPNAEAYYALGNIANEQGSPEIAIGYLEQAIKLKPDHIAALCELGNIQTEFSRYDEAFKHYHTALKFYPDHSMVHKNMGTAYKQIGNLDKSREHYQLSINGNPGFPQCYRNLASITKYSEIDDDVTKMLLLVEKNKITNDQRMELCFGLAKAYEDIKDFDKSFIYLQRGNDLKRKTIDYSTDATRHLFQRIKTAFSTEGLSPHNHSGCMDDTPIFIVGMPRSGTSLVEQILASHPQVCGAGELMDLIDITNNLHNVDGSQIFPDYIVDAGPETFNKIGELYTSRLRKHSSSSRYITDKMPSNFIRVGLIKLILPKARIIHCTRDPIDNCLSIYKNYFTGRQNFAYNLAEIADYYLEYHSLMEHWNSVLPGCIYNISYEAFVADQENQTRELLNYCNLPWDDACLDFYKTERKVATASAAQVRQPIYSNSVQLWKQYEAHLEPLITLESLTTQ